MGNNVAVPYSGHIPDGVRDGTDVELRIRTRVDFNTFSINLCTGTSMHNSDTAFHFNPRREDKKVVMNHKQGDSWGEEYTEDKMPFKRGHFYVIHLIVKGGVIKVKINNSLFAKFKHRLPIDTIHYLYVEGDIGIETINFKTKGSGLCPVPGASHLYDPKVPVAAPIIFGLRSWSVIHISGVPFPNCSRFTINLATGPFDSNDFALHFDARLNYGNDHGVVVCTHKQGENFGEEERHQDDFPFAPDTKFNMTIALDVKSFKIAINDKHFAEFNHRIPYDTVNHILITGDATIKEIQF